MRLASIVLLLALFFTGCKSPKTRDDAVMKLIPPRVEMVANTSSDASKEDKFTFPGDDESGLGDRIRLLENSESSPSNTSLVSHSKIDEDNQVVATVNNAPIFASEILERYNKQLEAAQKQISAEEYAELRKSLIKRDLKPRIERKLLVENLHSSLEDEQIKAIENQLSAMFALEVKKLKKEFNVHSNIELEQELQKNRTSLSSLKDEFANQRMAMEYLGAKANVQREFSRQDLLQYYNDHEKDYETPDQVQWQQIQVSFNKHDGRTGAFEVIHQVVLGLKNRTDFAELAKKYSDGPTASEGGNWDWTQTGSLTNEDIEKALFELPVGEISQIEQDDSFHLVRVTKRQKAGVVPFEELQKEIREKLQQESQKGAVQKVLDDLFETAVIEYHIPE